MRGKPTDYSEQGSDSSIADALRHESARIPPTRPLLTMLFASPSWQRKSDAALAGCTAVRSAGAGGTGIARWYPLIYDPDTDVKNKP